MKGILGKNKWIAVLLCITMLLCISPLSPLVAFGEDGDAGVSDSVEGDAGDVSTEDGSMDGDTTGDNGQSTDGVTDGEETSDGEETTEGTGDGTEETPDGAENQPADGEQQEGTEGNQPADGEQEEEITDENVPKTEVPAASGHMDGCSDECTGEGCTCPCHLYQRLMACETFEELMMLIEATPEEALLALTEDEVMQIEAKIVELEPQPLPPVGEECVNETYISEIIYPAVNVDNVAPFGDPVVGGR